MPCFLAFSRAPSQAFLENSWSAAISAAVNGFGFCAAATSKNDEDLALWYHGHHGRGRRHRGIGPDDEIDLVDLEQLGVDARHWARRTLIVVVDELDWAPEQAALGVGLLLPDLHAQQRLLAVRRQRASQRHGEADLDRLPGRRLGLCRRQEHGHRGRGEERGHGASPFQSCKHAFLQLADVLTGILGDPFPIRLCSHRPHTWPATSMIIRSFAHCSSSARILPSSVEAKPHCGERQNCSIGANFPASSMRRLMSSLFSSVPLLDVTRPSTTTLLPLGKNRSGSNPPARSVSYSRK